MMNKTDKTDNLQYQRSFTTASTLQGVLFIANLLVIIRLIRLIRLIYTYFLQDGLLFLSVLIRLNPSYLSYSSSATFVQKEEIRDKQSFVTPKQPQMADVFLGVIKAARTARTCAVVGKQG